MGIGELFEFEKTGQILPEKRPVDPLVIDHALPIGHISRNCKDCRVYRAESLCKEIIDWLDQNGHGDIERKRWPDLHNGCFVCDMYDKAKALFTR